MKKFLKENIVLVAGITLPVLMIVVFAIVSTIPKYFVDDPQYNFLFTTNNHNYYCGEMIKIDVHKRKVRVQLTHDPKLKNSNCYNNQRYPEIYMFDATKGTSKRYYYDVPEPIGAENNEYSTQEIVVEKLQNVRLDTSNIAPDGYEYRNNYDRHYPGLMGAFFYGSYDKGPTIAKDSRVVAVKYGNKGYRYYSGINFLGWVVEE